MSDHQLGGGAQVTSLQITPRFTGGVPSAKLIIPDNLFPDARGLLRHSSGPNPDANTISQMAMNATATMKFNRPNHSVGFKQVISFKFQTLLYAGRKDSDGCIEETSTGLNFRFILDCSADQNLQSPWAPFYLPRKLAPNGAQATIELGDQPGGKARLQRRNVNRDRLNFLVSFSASSDFDTCVVVELPTGEHVPLAGFSWTYSQQVDISWTTGDPVISRNTGSCQFVSKTDDMKSRKAQFDIFTNANLRTGDTMVSKFNTAMFAAQAGGTSGDYSITQFDNYTDNITMEMQGRLPN